ARGERAGERRGRARRGAGRADGDHRGGRRDTPPPRAARMTPVVSLEDVWLKLGATPVLSGLSLALDPGEVLALLGPSGAGKTTVVRLILGFIAPEHGSVRLNGAVASADGRVLRLPEERNLAVVLQEPA